MISDQFKAICTDIDGTLLDKHRQLSSHTIEAIRKIKDRVPVILASSRMPAAMRHLQVELGIEQHPLICFNGAYVIQYIAGSNEPVVLDNISLSMDVCKAIVERAQSLGLHVSIFSRDEWFTPVADEWVEREERITKVSPQLKPLKDVLHQWTSNEADVHKVMCMGDAKILDSLLIDLQQFSTEIHTYRSKSTYIEIAPRAISKSSALRLVLGAIYNLDLKDAVAFGDNYNDIELLQEAGCGVAVANARPEAKAVAKEITLSNVDHGVAMTIGKYFF